MMEGKQQQDRPSRTTPLRLGVGIPAYGGKVSMEHTRMWMDFGHVLATSEARFTLTMFGTVDVCGIDRARNLLVKQAIMAGCDWLLMLDADTWVDDGAELLRMISDADRQDFMVVAGAVPRRHADGTRELAVYRRASDDAEAPLVPLDDAELALDFANNKPIDDIIQIAAAGTACMAIKMEHIAGLGGDYAFSFTAHESEDLSFCRRVRAVGGRIGCDRRVATRHLNRPSILRGLEPA